MKRKISINRRTLIKGAGSIAISLPWLEAMGAPNQTGKACRFLGVYTPGGTVHDQWHCTGNENNYQLSNILGPMQKSKNDFLVMHGIDMKTAIKGLHTSGMIGWLTATPESNAHNNLASGPSIDQVIAKKIGNDTPKKHLHMSVRWATGKSKGRITGRSQMVFEDNGKATPIPPRLDPKVIWKDLFGTIESKNNPEAAAQLEREKSILDFVNKRYDSISQSLGMEDRQRLEQHLDKIRELEKSIVSTSMTDQGAVCLPPELVDTKGYNPSAGLGADNGGKIKDISTDESIPKVGKLFLDMIVMAMACDITNVATMQWTDTEAKHTFPWLNLNQHHHYYQHDGGYRPAELTQIGKWYTGQHQYLLNKMKNIDVGGHSLLDESVVFFGSELGKPNNHKKLDMPFLLAGRGGGLKPGRLLRFNGRPHNDLLASIVNLFGYNRNNYGTASYGSGSALPGLTG